MKEEAASLAQLLVGLLEQLSANKSCIPTSARLVA